MAAINDTPEILICDDDQDDIDFLIEAINSTGHNGPVRSFNDGQEFLEYYQGCIDASIPNVVVLDWNMPILSGQEVLETLSLKFPQNFSEVIVFSTSRRDKDVLAATSLGGTDYHVKPSSYGEMVAFAQHLKDHFQIAKHKYLGHLNRGNKTMS